MNKSFAFSITLLLSVPAISSCANETTETAKVVTIDDSVLQKLHLILVNQEEDIMQELQEALGADAVRELLEALSLASDEAEQKEILEQLSKNEQAVVIIEKIIKNQAIISALARKLKEQRNAVLDNQ